MRGISQSGLVPVKDRNGVTISGKKRVKGKDIEDNEKVCDSLNVKEDLFCEEESVTILKRLKIIRLQVLTA